MMRAILSGVVLTGFAGACASSSGDEAWIPIFDGETLDGWTPKISGQPLGQDERAIFTAGDGVIRVSYQGYDKFENVFGHLYFRENLANYRLRFEYRFYREQAPDGPAWAFMNSGVMVHAQPPETMRTDQAFPISVEAQLLGSSDATPERTTANICTPGTHITVEGEEVTQHCIVSTTPAASDGVWVSFEIEVRGRDQVRLQINGDDAFVLTDPVYDTTDPDVARLGWQGPVNEGYFALQAESHPIEFRNIALLRLD